MSDSTAARTAMVDCQVRPSDVTKFPIIDALLTIPREEFIPESKRGVAYVGEHIALSKDRTLLDARTFAKMLETVNIQPDEMVLDLGCGLGYSTAVLAKLSEAVVAVESDEDMAAEATNNLSAQSIDNAFVLAGELTSGAAKHGPYDVIILQGSVETIPDGLSAQVKDGGRIVALFKEHNLCQCRVGWKLSGKMNWRAAFEGSAPLLKGFETEKAFSLL